MKDFDGSFGDLNIRALLIDPDWGSTLEYKRYIKGEMNIPSCYRMLISLLFFHNGVRSMNGIQQISGIVERRVTCLDEFLESVFEIFKKMKERGVVGLKDQSAYVRPIDYGVEPKAERLFNRCLEDPNTSLGWPEAKPLDDYLFHEYMRFARRLDLPVQVHTGHMAGLRNRVDKANAALFTSVLELHSEVRFDLFHGNWPYAGDILFLIKNYPNAYMNMCWVNIIDPAYSSRLLERAVLTASHVKVNGFGGDSHAPELVSAHLKIAKRNICQALSKLIESSWLSAGDALGIAADWLHNNPNRLFKLGFDEARP
jgi:predicted TIM-barrel fold metal-dependent hydrolase